MTATQMWLIHTAMGRNISTMHTMVEAVLTLPDQPAAITRPLSAATILRPDTLNSRMMTTSRAQPGICPISTNHSIAATTRHLSARGSINFPKSVTWL